MSDFSETFGSVRDTDRRPAKRRRAPAAPKTYADHAEALRNLVDALESTYWSSWQSTANFQAELDRAKAVLGRDQK